MGIDRSLILGVVIAALSAVPASAETPLERGTYLMRSIVACGNCHTPLGPDGPVEGQELAGRLLLDINPFTAYAANITPDVETGIGGWSDDEIVTAIREGKRPDGTLIGPPMPIGQYRGLSDNDAQAIVAYMRALPAVKNEVPKSVYRIPLPENYGPPVGIVADIEPGITKEYGAYLAGPAGHCIECHTPQVKGRRYFVNQLGAGGFEFEGPWGVSVSANLTSHPSDGIAEFSDEDLIGMITTGTRPDGSKMLPPMGYAYHANIKPDHLKAIIAYLRSLPAKPDPS